jgi:predicted TIM-barrel fold metal-dependent hydrolase
MTKQYRLLAILPLALFCATASAQTVAPKLIDCHVHYNGDPEFIHKLVARLDSVDGLAFLLVRHDDLATAKPLIDKAPNRLIGFGNIDLDDPRAIEYVDEFHAAGFRGLGELETPLKQFYDPSYWPIYERAEKYKMIILFHTGIVMRVNPDIPVDVSIERMRVTTLDGVARHFPGITLIGAHLGNPDYAWAGELARWHPNLLFDLSGSTLIKTQNNYAFFNSIFWWSGIESPHTPKSAASAFEKVVFGSDVFGGDLEEFDLALARYHKMLDTCAVPKSAQDNIFAGTMWRILQKQ